MCVLIFDPSHPSGSRRLKEGCLIRDTEVSFTADKEFCAWKVQLCVVYVPLVGKIELRVDLRRDFNMSAIPFENFII